MNYWWDNKNFRVNWT